MMRKYNTRKTDGFNTPFIRGMVIVIALVIYGVSYSEITQRYKNICQELKKLEMRDDELTKLLANEMARWAIKKSPGQLDIVLAKHGLNLVWPKPKQIVRLYDTNRQDSIQRNFVAREGVAVRSKARESHDML